MLRMKRSQFGAIKRYLRSYFELTRYDTLRTSQPSCVLRNNAHASAGAYEQKRHSFSKTVINAEQIHFLSLSIWIWLRDKSSLKCTLNRLRFSKPKINVLTPIKGGPFDLVVSFVLSVFRIRPLEKRSIPDVQIKNRNKAAKCNKNEMK